MYTEMWAVILSLANKAAANDMHGLRVIVVRLQNNVLLCVYPYEQMVPVVV